MCVNGADEVYTCPDNLQFNTATLQCDRPERVKCDDKGINSGNETNGWCPRKGGPLFPLGNDCKLSYFCDAQNKAQVHPCAEGLLFDYIGQYCTEPEYARCNKSYDEPNV